MIREVAVLKSTAGRLEAERFEYRQDSQTIALNEIGIVSLEDFEEWVDEVKSLFKSAKE